MMPSHELEQYFAERVWYELETWRRRACAPAGTEVAGIEFGNVERRHHADGITWTAEFNVPESGTKFAKGWVSMDFSQFDMDVRPDE